MDILIAMLKVWVAIIIGYILYKKGVTNKESNTAMSKLVVNVASPCLIFGSVVTMGTEYKGDAYILLILGVAIYIFLGALSFVVVKLMRVPKEKFAIYLCLLMFGNVGFMGYPLAESLFGNVGLFYMGILNIHFTLFTYTFGIYILTKNSEKKAKFSLKTIINPGVVSVVLATVIYLLEIELPDVIVEPIEFVGQLTSPVAMIVLGGTLASFSLKEVFSDWRNYVVSAFKLVVFPLLGFLIMNALLGTDTMTITTTIYLGVPSANFTLMIILAYGGDVKTVSSGIGLTTILSAVTIPLLWFFIKAVTA